MTARAVGVALILIGLYFMLLVLTFHKMEGQPAPAQEAQTVVSCDCDGACCRSNDADPDLTVAPDGRSVAKALRHKPNPR